MALRQALETAAVLEREIRNLYREASARTDDPAGKRVLRLMAEEEAGHLQYLEARLAALDGAGPPPGELPEGALPDLSEIKALAAAPQTTTAHPASAELEVLQKIRAAEQKTAAFYRDVLKDLPDSAAPLFRRFAEIENGHLLLVEAEIDHLTHRGAWIAVDHGELRQF